ncbi:MAG: hypothetical protein PHI59_00965, partial [Candidatus Omnitrophica bacterium]|nr:hypothetical protein [Candidatus Omnitrophota bacterium]
KLKGKTIFDGLELFDPVVDGAVVDIERLDDGRMNLAEAGTLIAKKVSAASAKKRTEERKAARNSQAPAQAPEKKQSAEPIKLPEKFTIRNAEIIFADSFARRKPGVITFENINGEGVLRMDEHYTRVLTLDSTGEGNINGDTGQVIKWDISLDPTTPRLTMANRFDIHNVDIVTFEPYYDRYSPLVFKAGRVSGLLICDFNNGNIGSSDELRLSGLKFYVKRGYENAIFWETTVPDLVKYFATPYGEIVFDFKIKGDMTEPKFFLGPKSKAALVSMAVDKISTAIQEGSGGSGGSNSSADNIKDYIELFKGLMKK